MPVKHALTDHVVQRLERQIRIDCRSSIADQQTVVMHLAGIARFDNEGCFRARSFTYQVMMQACGGQQARDRRVILIDLPVGQNQNRCTGPYRQGCRFEEILQSAAHSLSAFGRFEAHRKRHGTEPVDRDVA